MPGFSAILVPVLVKRSAFFFHFQQNYPTFGNILGWRSGFIGEEFLKLLKLVFRSFFKPYPVLIQSLSGAYPAPNLSLSFPYPVLMRSLSNPYPVFVQPLSGPYPTLIRSSTCPYPVLIQSLSGLYPILIRSLSKPYPVLIC